LLHYVVIHKITKKQVIIADPGAGLVKMSPDEFFGEVKSDKPITEGDIPKYQWWDNQRYPRKDIFNHMVCTAYY